MTKTTKEILASLEERGIVPTVSSQDLMKLMRGKEKAVISSVTDYRAFIDWVSKFKEAYDDGQPILKNSLDDSFIELTGNEPNFHVVVGNESMIFDHLPEAIVWLWRNHSVDNII